MSSGRCGGALSRSSVPIPTSSRLSTRPHRSTTGFVDHREDPYSYWVDTQGAADILGISAVRVRQLCAEGRIPFLLRAGVRTHRMLRRHQIEVIGNAREALRLGHRHGG